jgi:DNA-binding transcriptional LysR family regulator
MQKANWNDLRYLLAVGRGQKLAAAAKSLGVDDTTVARRLAALQTTMRAPLYQRLSDGKLQLTEAGERAALIAETVEREMDELEADLSGSANPVSGVVRLTSVPIIINRILVPDVGGLLERHPGLRLELIADAKDLSLTRREADLALRLARPKSGGTRIKARRVGQLHYKCYAPADCSRREAAKMPWITYDETMLHLPQARWISAEAGRKGGRVANVRVNDSEAALEAVIAGLGRSLLPCHVADRDDRLRRVDARSPEPALSRELWLLVHAELRNLKRIEAVTEWIDRSIPR